jgi:GNAT superfamily N-acetyltransferase
MNLGQPLLRVATPDDTPRVEALMKESTAALFPLFYDDRQTASAVKYVAEVDPMLLEDGTYFVIESVDEMIGCGGWSRRDKLYTGRDDSRGDARLLDSSREAARVRAMFVRPDWTRRGLGRRILEECEGAARREGFGQLTLGATLPGVPLYLAFGFHAVEEIEVTMPDGVTLECVTMEKPIDATVVGAPPSTLPTHA